MASKERRGEERRDISSLREEKAEPVVQPQDFQDFCGSSGFWA
jgi:hypothetical protein